MNSLDVNPEELDSQAQQLALVGPQIEPDPPPAPEPEIELESVALEGTVENGWRIVVEQLVTVSDALVFPQWKLQKEEKEVINESLCAILDQIFPGGIGNEKWAPYIRLVLVSGSIVLTRLDPKTRSLPPLGLPEPEPESGQA